MRIYLANVGANSSHRGLHSPFFSDGRFEFLPIPEGDTMLNRSPHAVSYRDLRSHYDPSRDLLQYVRQDMSSAACHNDPEFATFTYGDNGTNGRSAALTRMEKGDVLLFLARLEGWARGKPTGEYGLYLIGGLLADYAAWITPGSRQIDRFANNAHTIRGDYQYWGIAGSSQSRRFERAVPINREICEKIFSDAKGNPWTWSTHRTELTVINSYTRACRCMLDTSDASQSQPAAVLREWIPQHSGASDAELLSGIA